jgi:chromo domain-containing protein 1
MLHHEKWQFADHRPLAMTERTVVKQSKVDDDAISLTSTLSSEYGSDDEFSVDRILADKTEGNKKKYLILWEGYPLEKATWEPHKNINDEILEVWKERKSRESKGLDPPFDVAEFDALLARLAAEKADRHRRRKAKRKRLRLAVSPAPSDADDSDSSVEAIEENEVEDVRPGAKRKSKSPPKRPAKALKPLNGRRGSTSSLASLDTARAAPEKKASGMFRPSPEKPQPPSRQASEVCVMGISSSRESCTWVQQLTTCQGSRHSRTLSQSSSDTPLSRKRPLQRPSVDRPGSSSSDGPLALKHPKPSAAPPAKSDVWKLTSAKKSTSSTEPTALARGLHSTRGTYTVARGRVATRGGGNVTHKNVFQAREPPKQRGNLLKNARDAAKVPKKFTNMRLHRKAELQARDLAEGAPDISALGGLFDPSKPDSMVPIRPENLRKTPSNMVSLEEPNPLFVNSRENSPVADDPWSIKSNQPQPPVQIPPALRGMSTCHYWDKQQKDSSQPPCQMGTACKFLHRYVAGLPIAPAPNSVGADPRRTDTSGSDDAWSNPQTAPIERKVPAGPPQMT